VTTHLINRIEIQSMTKDHAQEALALSCEVFVEASALHSAIDISVKEYRQYMDAPFRAMVCQGLSLVAVDTKTGKLVGCLVACDYLTQGQKSTMVPDKLKPVNALLSSLDDTYRKIRQLQTGQCMLVDMAVVTPTERGLGIYSRLRETAHKTGQDAGFSLVVGELSSAATQHLCVNHYKHRIYAEIEYSTFKYMGKTPFSSIKTPRSILLAEGAL